MTAFKIAKAPDNTANDVEATIARAKRAARRGGCAVDIVGVPRDTHIATVWPDGKVDVSWAGRRHA